MKLDIDENLLSKKESKLLDKLHCEMKRDASKIAKNFATIKEKKLYRYCGTFEDYCQKEWNFTPQHMNRMLAFETVKANLKSEPMGSLLVNERQARPLVNLEPEEQIKAFNGAVKLANGKKPTAKEIAAAVEKQAENEESEPRTPLDEFYDAHHATREIANRIHALVRAWEELAADSHPHISAQSVANHLRAAAAEIRMGQPYGICPYCKGKKCPACRKSGYVNKVVFNMSPKDKREGIETR